jgi:hypothetical protein
MCRTPSSRYHRWALISYIYISCIKYIILFAGGLVDVFRAPVEWAGAWRGGRTNRNQLLSIAGEKTPRSKGRYRWQRRRRGWRRRRRRRLPTHRVCLRYVWPARAKIGRGRNAALRLASARRRRPFVRSSTPRHASTRADGGGRLLAENSHAKVVSVKVRGPIYIYI